MRLMKKKPQCGHIHFGRFLIGGIGHAGEIVEASGGRRYEVQKDGSLRRLRPAIENRQSQIAKGSAA